MRQLIVLIPAAAAAFLLALGRSNNGQPPLAHAAFVAQSQGCTCSNSAELASRQRAVQAVIQLLDSRAAGPGMQARFDANTFDSGLGDQILQTEIMTGGLGAIPGADFDRFSCQIQSIPMVGSSPCLNQSLNTRFAVRQQACQRAQRPGNQGNDYWEGMTMADVVRELRASYAAEDAFITQQQARGGAGCPARVIPTRNICDNCLHYMFDAKQTLPIVGTIRLWADEMIPFTVSGNTVTGNATINTILDMSGSPCTMTGYNGVADFNFTGRINGANLDVVITPRGSSQRVSAATTIKCPPGGSAHTFPQSQTYTLTQTLPISPDPRNFSEKRLDVGVLSRGAMTGEVILRLRLLRP